ncbi:hypothetical protein KKE60_05535 [Patescibacteria group bacterium]|nr:hypothetical protein [Patescibacteria group bacterium]
MLLEQPKVYPAATMTPADAPVDPAEGYELVRNLIFDQVHKFSRRYGGDFDELVGEANLAFVKGHNQFITGMRPSGKPFDTTYATEIRRWVWFELFDAMRTRLQRQARAQMISVGDMDYPVQSFEFDVTDWAAGLSSDASYVVELLLDPPEDVEEIIMAKGGEPRNFRSTVRAYLVASGWSARRISEAFAEIKEALG